jgi:hypothetical protein
MTSAAFPAPAASVASRTSPLARWARRFVNAIVESRIRDAERELRRHAFAGETALTHGQILKVRLNQADLLPFNR